MYVRSYNEKPRLTLKETAPPIPAQTVEAPLSPEGEQNDATVENKAQKVESAAAVSESTNQGTSETANSAAPPFGLSPIPRQPLRRRKLPQRDRLKAEQADGNAEPKRESGVLYLPERTEAEHKDKCANNIENRSDSASASLPCGVRPPKKEDCGDGNTERRTCGPFTSEELLLGGLILLLISDRGNEDIIIMLAFLLVSGFSRSPSR